MSTVPALHNITVPLTHAQIEDHQRAHLEDLQGNILKGHGRDHAAHVFLQFKDSSKEEARTWIKTKLKPRIVSAYKQLKDTQHFHQTGQKAGAFHAFFLTAKGYTFFDHALDPFEATFKSGQRGSIDSLNDPKVSAWDSELQPEFHAMLLIADLSQANVAFLVEALKIEIAAFGTAEVVFGDQQKNERGDGIEHFGYVDGRSQPLMLESDLAKESDGTTVWDPSAGPSLVLVPDPLGAPGASGSYFVFRKLEEKVKAFKIQEQNLATALGLVGEKRELAGALVVGRFEDGTPVTLFDEPKIEGSATPNGGVAPNNFTYALDQAGAKCPFQGHIRKSNPRGTGPGGLADENSRRMARRGITYGARTDDFKDIEKMPEGGVGLLFMSYQRSIADQFEFIQKLWVNNPNFPQAGVGIDPTIGQGGNTPLPVQKWPKVWDDLAAGTVDFDFRDFVVMRGGEYFFAPSLSGIANL